MSFKIDAPITWQTVIRIGLGFGAEYALLALIEDAPSALKIATMLCALIALFILETGPKSAQSPSALSRIYPPPCHGAQSLNPCVHGTD
jgi:hypothetical protein